MNWQIKVPRNCYSGSKTYFVFLRAWRPLSADSWLVFSSQPNSLELLRAIRHASSATSDDDSLQDFHRDAIQNYDAGPSLSTAPTIATAGSSKTGDLEALPGLRCDGLIACAATWARCIGQKHALEGEVVVEVMTSESDSLEIAE